MRIVISTANFIQVDFENKTNAFWMQDFPKKTSRSKPMTDFEENLIHYLETMKDVDINHSRLRDYDFGSATVS